MKLSALTVIRYSNFFLYNSPPQARKRAAACSGVISLCGSAIISYLQSLVSSDTGRCKHADLPNQELPYSCATEQWRIEVHMEMTGFDFFVCTLQRRLMDSHALHTISVLCSRIMRVVTHCTEMKFRRDYHSASSPQQLLPPDSIFHHR
jgi:hypothetical protein